jgi:hypothetical protein
MSLLRKVNHRPLPWAITTISGLYDYLSGSPNYYYIAKFDGILSFAEKNQHISRYYALCAQHQGTVNMKYLSVSPTQTFIFNTEDHFGALFKRRIKGAGLYRVKPLRKFSTFRNAKSLRRAK